MTMATIMRTATITMLDYEFMRNAFAAAGIAAVVSGLVGYFLVLRGQTFAGHALSHIGFAGATGAVLLGVASVWGLVGFTIAAGIGMGLLGERLSGRDVAMIRTILASVSAKRGLPGSTRLTALRLRQQQDASLPTSKELSATLQQRLADKPRTRACRRSTM